MNTEFENIMLKVLTHNGVFFGKAMPILKEKYFSGIGSQELFKLIREYYGEYKLIPSLTELVAKVKDVSNAEIRKEIILSLKTISGVEEVQNLDFMLNETVSWVKDALYLEALQVGSDGLMKKDDTLKLKAQKLMDERSKICIDSDLGIDFDDIETMIEYYTKRDIGIRTQHKSLNKRLGPGFLPGTLSVIMAAASVGKSLMMSDLISGMLQKNKNILMVSLEMSDKENMKRVHANTFDLPINHLRDLSLTDSQKEAIHKKEPSREFLDRDMVLGAYNRLKVSGQCGKLYIKDYAPGTFSALMLEQLVESYSVEKGIKFDIVFVDYLGIMKSDLVAPSVGLYSYVKSIGEELRSSFKKMNIPGISASQLNRGAYNADGKEKDAGNESVSDSIGTIMTADFIMFLLQNEAMKKEALMVCKVTKNRFTGLTDTWTMNIDYTRMKFFDVLIQDPDPVKLEDVQDVQDVQETPKDKGEDLNEDFATIAETPAEKTKRIEDFAKNEVKDIQREDVEKIQVLEKKNPFKSDLDDLYKDLGLS